MGDMPKVILIQGASGSGKTTLIEQLLVLAASDHKNLGIIKSCGHEISIDAGISKDSSKFRSAGAKQILLHQGNQHTLFSYDENASLSDLIVSYFSDFDLVFVEGFATSCDFPRIIVLRSSITAKPISSKQDLIAFASDLPCVSPYADIPVLDINDPKSIYAFIMAQSSPKILSSMKINGKAIPMNHFVENILVNTVLGLVKSIKREDDQELSSLRLTIQLPAPSEKEQA
jgi:molybdopterin-guanine dinucleotide biosynthesis adapter protein